MSIKLYQPKLNKQDEKKRSWLLGRYFLARQGKKGSKTQTTKPIPGKSLIQGREVMSHNCFVTQIQLKKILKHGRLKQQNKMKTEILDLRKQNEVQTVLLQN